MQTPIQSYNPLRFSVEKVPTIESQILQLRKDFQNKNQNNPYTLEFHHPSLLPKPESSKEVKQPRFRLSTSKQRSKPTYSQDEYMKSLQKMQKKVKELLRETLCLAEALHDNQISMIPYEKTQERLRAMDDSLLQEEYHKLKIKLSAVNWIPKTQRIQLTQNTANRVSNPQTLEGKAKSHKTLRVQRAVDIKIPTSKVSGPSLSVQRNKTPALMRHSDINGNVQSEAGKKEEFRKQQLDALKKKIDHYRHKASKMQMAVDQLVHTNQTLNQLNEQINGQNVKLRSQLLNFKYAHLRAY